MKAYKFSTRRPEMIATLMIDNKIPAKLGGCGYMAELLLLTTKCFEGLNL